MSQPAEQIIKQMIQTASLIRAAQSYRRNLEEQLAAHEFWLNYSKEEYEKALAMQVGLRDELAQIEQCLAELDPLLHKDG